MSRLTNLPSAVGSELNSSVDFETRYPLPNPLDKINKTLFIESTDKERVVEQAFSEITPSMQSEAESTLSSTPSEVTGSFTPLYPHLSFDPDIGVKCFADVTGEGGFPNHVGLKIAKYVCVHGEKREKTHAIHV